jgi:predicted N-acetyltransferase YhbS
LNAVDLRQAGPDDVEAILELNRAGNGEHIKAEMDVVFRLGGMAPEDYAVAVVDGKVVATVGLLATTLRLGSVTLPVGQPEYIATDPSHQGQGLARRLLAMVQEWSEMRGDLVQVITGVAYFYRQYGYSYGLVRPPTLAIPPEHGLAMPTGWQVRSAEARDVGRIKELQDQAQSRVDVALSFADNLWRPFLEMPAAPLTVAVYDERVEAVGRVRLAPGSPVAVQALAASRMSPVVGLQAILAGVRAGYPGATLVVADREGSPTRAVVAPYDRPAERRGWLYVRLPSVVGLLSALTPVLDERLARSANVLELESGELVISWYRGSARLRLEHGRVVEVSAVPAVHEPDDEDGVAVGVAPDLVPLLLFGEGGVLALEDHPDVYLGRMRPLMTALFPPLTVDLLTW